MCVYMCVCQTDLYIYHNKTFNYNLEQTHASNKENQITGNQICVSVLT